MAAAAIVTGALSLAPSIIDLITRIVHSAAPAAEVKYGPKTGPVKFGDVFAAVLGALQNAAAAGQIDKALPNDEVIKLIIQTAVNSLQVSGVLAASTEVPAPQIVTLKPGQTLTIQGAA